MKKLIIFDLDGTLLCTLDDLTNSVNYALKQFGYPTKTVDEVRSFVGNGVQWLLKLSMPEDVSDNDFKKCFAFFKRHYAENCCVLTQPYSGIVEVLKMLKQKGIKIGVVSNKFQLAAEEVCDHYFKGLYDIVIGESEDCCRKPAPDGINKICKEFNIDKKDIVLFGDSEVDIKTAENAGIDCVSVLWGFRDKDFLIKNRAKIFVENPLEIFYIISTSKF